MNKNHQECLPHNHQRSELFDSRRAVVRSQLSNFPTILNSSYLCVTSRQRTSALLISPPKTCAARDIPRNICPLARDKDKESVGPRRARSLKSIRLSVGGVKRSPSGRLIMYRYLGRDDGIGGGGARCLACSVGVSMTCRPLGCSEMGDRV